MLCRWKLETSCPSPTRLANWHNSSVNVSTLRRSKIALYRKLGPAGDGILWKPGSRFVPEAGGIRTGRPEGCLTRPSAGRMVNNFPFPPSRGGVELHHERANERVICHRNAWLFGHGRWRGQTQPPKSYEPPNHQHRLYRRTTDSGKIFLRRQRRFAAAQVDERARKHQKLRAHRRRSRRARRHVGALGALRPATEYDRTSGRRGQNAIHCRQCEAGIEQLAAPGLWRAVSATRQTASLFFQTLRARYDARPQARRDEERR